MSNNNDLALGWQLHQAGRLPEAERAYRQSLARDENNAEAWHLLGVLRLQAGRPQEAAESIARAVSLKPGAAAFHNHLGIARGQLGQLTEAATTFRQAIACEPTLPDAHYNLANVLRDAGDAAGALESFRRAVSLRPNYAEAHYNLANLLRAQGDLQAAAQSFRRAVAAKPGYFKAALNLGDVLHELGDVPAAEAQLRQALALEPRSSKAHNNLGTVLRTKGDLPAAANSFRQAIALGPQSPEAHHNLGSTLLDQEQDDAALVSFQTALALEPRYAKAHNGVAAVLRRRGDFVAAEASFRRAAELDPRFPEAHTNLGCLMQDLGRLDEAEALFRQALALKPECPETNFALGSLDLLRGDFRRGWSGYEWRRRSKSSLGQRPSQPLWDGSPLDGRRILLHAEQGLGDTLQFIRYVGLVADRGGRATVGCPGGLHRLLTGVRGIELLVSEIALSAEFACQAPLLSLPLIFGTTLETIPADVPYLHAEPESVAKWRGVLAGRQGFKVGLNWQGNPKFTGDRSRSPGLAALAPLAQVHDACFISLQKGAGAEQLAGSASPLAIWPLAERLDAGGDAFVDTAAVMQSLDLVMTSDTSIAHLAGALGVPCWVALPFAPDWRWLLDREDSPWYPSLRLFRQPSPGDWATVFERMAQELAPLTALHACPASTVRQ